jgi:3'-phosphoadenosine 5'-phosphosulfate sulfotransferase (PAPS reductase)/FAD synthetase
MKDMLREIELWQDQAERSSAEQLLHWASERFGSRMAIASSFGGDAIVMERNTKPFCAVNNCGRISAE